MDAEQFNLETTIAAPATPPGTAGVAIIRISGGSAGEILSKVFRAKCDPREDPRRLLYGQLHNPQDQQVIDRAMAVFMPAPRSFTGEDMAEIHMHGSPLLVSQVLRILHSLGAKPAAAGEFSKRAFLNGKLDLVQAEGLCDFINATGDRAQQLAREQLEGRYSRAVSEIAEPLRDALAELEADLDFPEEETAVTVPDKILDSLSAAAAAMKDLAATYSFGQILREGCRVLLCGRPNVGKSSLMNALLGRARAIVTALPGTTRDFIEESLMIDGMRFVLCDSAGIAEGETDEVERIGIEIAREKINWADLIILVSDATEKESSQQDLLALLGGSKKAVLMVANKADLLQRDAGGGANARTDDTILVSAKTKQGLAELQRSLLKRADDMQVDAAESGVIVTIERHRDAFLSAEQALQIAVTGMQDGLPPEIICADIRTALHALDEIIGKTYTEDILGRIFERFCIGK